MQNSLQNTVFNSEHSGSSELIATGNSLRLSGIGLIFSLALAAILARVYWVQVELPDRYLSTLQSTTTEDTPIPARDGRILADSIVLASDTDVHRVEVHYRWLQESADSQWLQLQIRQRLSRDERRNPELVAKTEAEIVAERESLRDALSDVTQVPRSEILARFSGIEERVQRISDSVNLRRKALELTDEDPEDEAAPGLLMSVAMSIRTALTTPPTRVDNNRMVVREEEAWHVFLEEVSQPVAAIISEHPERFPGVRIVQGTRRAYPEHTLAAHVVGVRTNLRDSDLSEDASVVRAAVHSERVGRSGVERSYEHHLLGIAGLQRTMRDRRQRVISTEIVRHPVSGRDVTLTLDSRLQQLAEQLLAESLGDAPRLLLATDQTEDAAIDPTTAAEVETVPVGGCIIVMEADSGRLIAAASAPTFDLSMFVDGSSSMWKAVNGDTRRPFIPRFTGMALPPGSTFKIVTAIAGLESGVITANAPFECRGFLDNPDEYRCMVFRLFGATHGRVNLRTAMAQSCNVYFFDAARRMGIEPLVTWADQLQFGHPTGIDLPYEKSGTLPRAGSGASNTDTPALRRRFERDALGLAIGQSRLTVTPLQMARLLAFVANGGWLVTPHVVSDDGTARMATEIDNSPFRATRHRVPGITEGTLMAVRAGLKAAVDEPIGTGFKTVRLPDVSIAGKTGTAETGPDRPDHAWFTGYVPADDPKYVVVVVLEHGGSGSKAAGPVARELVRSLLERGLLTGSTSK